MSNRAERRRRERAERHKKTPVIVVGDNMVAASLGTKYEATGHAELPPKEAGKHRWIATGAWVLRDIDVEKAFDADTMKFLDNENLMDIGIACWDCERILGPDNKPGCASANSTCAAPASP